MKTDKLSFMNICLACIMQRILKMMILSLGDCISSTDEKCDHLLSRN